MLSTDKQSVRRYGVPTPSHYCFSRQKFIAKRDNTDTAFVPTLGDWSEKAAKGDSVYSMVHCSLYTGSVGSPGSVGSVDSVSMGITICLQSLDTCFGHRFGRSHSLHTFIDFSHYNSLIECFAGNCLFGFYCRQLLTSVDNCWHSHFGHNIDSLAPNDRCMASMAFQRFSSLIAFSPSESNWFTVWAHLWINFNITFKYLIRIIIRSLSHLTQMCNEIKR